VIGKFYPPHRGHRHLIETAQASVDHLTVIVCGKPNERPEPYVREAWMHELHPGVEIKLVDDRYDPADSRLWAELTVGWLGGAPDVAFTSEEYGARWAAFMGCQHVTVDLARERFPVSATAIRADPLAHWEFLDPCVRAFYVPRVIVVGSESTGTTTMAQALAEHYDTVWVPEYGREYSERMMYGQGPYVWTTEDFVHIAVEQSMREDAAARTANRLLIGDTDAFATAIWHQRYMGFRSPEVESVAAGRRCDLYLLTGTDIPFVQDGYRDGEKIRDWMHNRFRTELHRLDKPFVVLTGPHDHRLREAIAAIDQVLHRRAPMAR
jgi:NadR type nicotinamide-nucleotide adenylyltransferase